MRGVLVYTKEEAERNSFAVNKFTESLGVMLVNEVYRGHADYVINRTNDYRIAEYYEKQGIRVFNPSSLSKIANNKQACYDYMESKGIFVLPTRYDKAPVVKKANAGHGGTQVFMLDEAEEFEEGFVYQKPCNMPGRDVRVWVIGNEIITSVMRVSENDFRSNFCLGGKAVPYNLSDTETALVKKIITLINENGADYIGIDFIFHDGKMIFNEIEDTVGARMVYAVTDIDILGLYCEYIKREIQAG